MDNILLIGGIVGLAGLLSLNSQKINNIMEVKPYSEKEKEVKQFKKKNKGQWLLNLVKKKYPIYGGDVVKPVLQFYKNKPLIKLIGEYHAKDSTTGEYKLFTEDLGYAIYDTKTHMIKITNAPFGYLNQFRCV